ncbi:transposase [Streptomyces sp. NPDC090741]|uniref:transposase n=1 Tax=Streptomyces sp. NPDC090741 TaxID=3365967 RepID=UPI00380188D8
MYELMAPLTQKINPALTELNGIGPDVAGQLLVTAGDNPDRLRSEAAFAMLCGVAPLPAASGCTRHHPGTPWLAVGAVHVTVAGRREGPHTRDPAG